MSRRTWLAVLVILTTEAALAASHCLWASPWWREPLWWSDRWHLLSLLSHWPAAAFMVYHHLPPGRHWRNWWALAACSSALWWVIKAASGKGWDMWWVQAFKWWA